MKPALHVSWVLAADWNLLFPLCDLKVLKISPQNLDLQRMEPQTGFLKPETVLKRIESKPGSVRSAAVWVLCAWVSMCVCVWTLHTPQHNNVAEAEADLK